MWRRGGSADRDCRDFAEVLEDLTLAVFILASDMEIVIANGAARSLSAHGDRVLAANGCLRILHEGRHVELVRAVARAAAEPAPAGMWFYVGSLDRDAQPPLHLYVRGVAPGRAALYVVDPLPPSLPDGDLLRRMYRFSPAETRVVVEMLQGHSVEGTAEALSLSIHTVRAHLKNLFAKTGVRRQSDLLQLITTSQGCLRGPVGNHPFGGCANADERLDSERSSDSSRTSSGE